MKIKMYVLAVAAAVCCVGNLSAYPLLDMGALERAAVQATRAAEKEYKGFNPHLTQEQMNRIPQLVAKGKQELADSYSYEAHMFLSGLYLYIYDQMTEEIKA